MTSAAGQNGARPRRSSPVPTKAETQATNLLVGAESLSILIRGPCAKIAKISGSKGEPTQNGAIGLGHQPTQVVAGDRGGGGEQAASPDEVYGLIVDRGEAAGTAAVVLSRRLWQPREEVSITIWVVFSVLECVVKRGEVLEPPLDSRVMVPNFFDIFQSLVDRENAKLRASEVASKALEIAHRMLLASKSSGVQCLPESRVAPLT